MPLFANGIPTKIPRRGPDVVAGSIREKSKGVWELRVYLGRDDRGRVR